MNVQEIHNTNTDATLRLLMYRSMLAHDKAWLAGFEAAQTSQDIDENPFHSFEEEFKSWESGWWEGFYNESYTVYELTKELGVESKISNSSNDNSVSTSYQHRDNQPKKITENNNMVKINVKKALFLVGLVLFTYISMNMLLIE